MSQFITPTHEIIYFGLDISKLVASCVIENHYGECLGLNRYRKDITLTLHDGNIIRTTEDVCEVRYLTEGL